MFSKILKAIKILITLAILWLIILFISIYISSLNSYKESDFNIPKDYFNTKHFDKDPNSEENWYNDFVTFIESLDHESNVHRPQDRIKEDNYLSEKIDLYYFDMLSKCTFKDKTNKDWWIYDVEYCENMIDNYIIDKIYKEDKKEARDNKEKWVSIKKLGNSTADLKRLSEYRKNYEKQGFKELKRKVLLNQIKFKKINSKDFILQTTEYSWIVWKGIWFVSFITYSRVIRLISFDYFEKWQYKKWINLLLNYQKFIDNLIAKWDMNFLSQLVLISIHNININALSYFIDNYELDNKTKNKMFTSLGIYNLTWMVTNWIKWEYKISIDILEYAKKDIFNKDPWDNYYNYIKWIIEYNLFYSPRETKLLTSKKYYELIETKLNNNFSVDLNINNYVGRYLYNTTDYLPSYKKEEEMIKLRNDLLEKLKSFE